MLTATNLLIGLVVVVALWLYATYVGLIKKRNKAKEAFASIDVQLKQRYDLIPNILTIAQKFMEHETSLLEDITRLRTEVMKLSSDFSNIDRKIALDCEIANKMDKLIISIENYPQLKSDSTMLQAVQTYNEVEAHIAAERRFYNTAANGLKNAVEIFPSSLIARLINVKSVDCFNATEKERESIAAAEIN